MFLIETFHTSETVRIDREHGVLLGVKILGSVSKNGRVYPDETLNAAIPLYEGAKVNLNHPDGDPRKPRSYQDRFGVIRNVVLKAGDGLYADFYFNPKHALAEQLLWDAENAPENVGFSHNVEAVIQRDGEKNVVETIVSVRSVDLVADPATTSGLFEAAENEEWKTYRERIAYLEHSLSAIHGQLSTVHKPVSKERTLLQEPLNTADFVKMIKR